MQQQPSNIPAGNLDSQIVDVITALLSKMNSRQSLKYPYYEVLYIINAVNNAWLAAVGGLQSSQGNLAIGITPPAFGAAGFNSFTAGYYSSAGVFTPHLKQAKIKRIIRELITVASRSNENLVQTKIKELEKLLNTSEEPNEATIKARAQWITDRLFAFFGNGVGCGFQTFGGMVIILLPTSSFYIKDLKLSTHHAMSVTFLSMGTLLTLLMLISAYRFAKQSKKLEENIKQLRKEKVRERKEDKEESQSQENQLRNSILTQLMTELDKRAHHARRISYGFVLLGVVVMSATLFLCYNHLMTLQATNIVVFVFAGLLSLATLAINYYLSRDGIKNNLLTTKCLEEAKITPEESTEEAKIEATTSSLNDFVSVKIRGMRNTESYEIKRWKLYLSKVLSMLLVFCNSASFAALVFVGVLALPFGSHAVLLPIAWVFFAGFFIANLGYVYIGGRDLFISCFGKKPVSPSEHKTWAGRTSSQKALTIILYPVVTFGVYMLVSDAAHGLAGILHHYFHVAAGVSSTIGWVSGVMASICLLVFFIRTGLLLIESMGKAHQSKSDMISVAGLFSSARANAADSDKAANNGAAAKTDGLSSQAYSISA